MTRRILLVITDLQIGGTPTIVRELARRLRGPNAEISVACLALSGPVGEQIAAAGVKVTALNARRPAELPRTAARLVNLIRDEGIDTVMSFLVHANCVCAVASTFSPGVRFIQSIQTTQPAPRWHWWAQAIAAHAADAIVVPSPSVAQAAAEWSGIAPARIVVIPNAVEPRNEPVIRPVGRRVGFIGRLDPIKRVVDLVRSAAMLDDVELQICGEGEDRRRIEAEIARLNLGGRATLRGSIASPDEALGRIDVLVLPSEAEGFGLVLIEAMNAGVPVVATRAPGIRDVVRDGTTGLLVPVGDPRALADAIRAVLTNGSLRRSLIAAGRREVLDRFTWERILPQYRRLFGLALPATMHP